MRGDGVIEFPYHRHTTSHSAMLRTFHNQKNTSFDMFYNSTYLHHAMSHADRVTTHSGSGTKTKHGTVQCGVS